MGALIALGVGALGLVVYEVYLSYLNRKKAKSIVEQTIRENNLSEASHAVVDRLEKKQYNVVKVDLYNKSRKKIAEIKIKADQVSNDLDEGTVLKN